MKDNPKADISHTDEFDKMYKEMVKQAEDKYKVKSEHPKTEEEDLIPKFGEYSDNEPLDVPTMTIDFVKEHGLPCPDGYIFKDEKGNVINAQKIVLEKVNTLKIQSNNMETDIHRGYCTTEEETTNKSKKVAWFTFEDNDFADKVELALSNRELIQEDGKWFVVKKKKSVIREEQIDNAAQEYIDSDNAVLTYSDGFCEQTDHPFVRAAFKAGVEWADNNVTQNDCSKAPKLTSQDYSNGGFGYQLPAGFKAKLTERELILTPEKPKYPKTYEECCRVLGYDDRETYCIFHTGADERLFEALYRLKVCRDAYWKIAGEEMGLGKPWEPDWKDGTTHKFVIHTIKDKIYCGVSLVKNQTFSFPTPEMRDAFKENFDKDLEFCKELL